MGPGPASGDAGLRHGLRLYRLAAGSWTGRRHCCANLPVGRFANIGFRRSVPCLALRRCCRSRFIPMSICWRALRFSNSRARLWRRPASPGTAAWGRFLARRAASGPHRHRCRYRFGPDGGACRFRHGFLFRRKYVHCRHLSRLAFPW